MNAHRRAPNDSPSNDSPSNGASSNDASSNDASSNDAARPGQRRPATRRRPDLSGSAASGADRVRPLARPLVVGTMVGCIALSVARLARLLAEAVGVSSAGLVASAQPSPGGQILSAWNPAYFFLACVLAALEAYYGRRWTESMEGAELWKFRAREVLAFFLLLKLGSYLGEPWPAVQADIRTWLQYPARILSAEMILALLLSFLSWFAATQTIRDLERLDESLEYGPGFFSDAAGPLPMESLSARFLWGGAVLLIVAGLNRVGIAALLNVERPPVPGIVLNVLVYFLLGLVMLGQVRFVTMQVEWRGQKASVASELRGQWVRYSLAFIGLAAVVSFLLPTGYTTYLLDVLGVALAVIVQILYLVGSILMILLSLPFWLIAWLFMRDEAPPLPTSRLPFRPPEQPDLGREPPNWLGVARAVFFWVVALSIAYYLVRGFLREHPDIWQAILSFAPLRWLRRLWLSLSMRFRILGATIRERFPRRRGNRPTASGEVLTGGLLSSWRSTRGRVLYYYLNVLQRAAKLGFHRRVSQTPDEFSVILERNLPETREDMAFLTDAFKEARYSRHEVEPTVVQRARAGWQRIKRDLQIVAHPTRAQYVRRRPVVPPDEGQPEQGTDSSLRSK